MQPVIIVLHLLRLELTNRPKMKLKILDRIQYLQKCNDFFTIYIAVYIGNLL